MISYDELCMRFCDLEKREDLFSLEFNGVKYWKYARYILCCFMQKKLKERKIPDFWMNPENELSNRKYTYRYQKFTDKLFHNVFLAREKDIMLFTFQRRVKYKSKYISPVTDEIAINLKRNACIIETPYCGGYYRPSPIRGIKYFDLWEGVYDGESNYVPINRGYLSKQLLHLFEREFEIKFTTDEKKTILLCINRCIMFRDEIMSRYRKMLTKVNPKVVLYTMSYINEWVMLTEVLREMGIPSVEILHGYVAENNMAYTYSEAGLNDALPDYIFAYSEAQKNAIKWGIPRERIRVVGNPWLEKKKALISEQGIQKKKKQIVFISGAISSIEKYIVTLAEKIDQDKYDIIFKLHPEEYGCWEKIYKELPASVEVVDSNENDIHYYLARADVVIGITSTALFEAAIYSAKIIVLQEDGWFSMNILLKAGRASLVHDVRDLFSVISNDSVQETKKNSNFYAEHAIENVNNEIEKIIMKGKKDA